MSIECECLSWADGGYRETLIDCRKALHKQHCAELLFRACTCSRGQSVGILPNQTRTAGSAFSLLSPLQLLVLTTGPQRAFCQWSATCTIPTWGPRSPIPQGGKCQRWTQGLKALSRLLTPGQPWPGAQWVSTGLAMEDRKERSTHRRLSSDHPRKHRSSGTETYGIPAHFNTDLLQIDSCSCMDSTGLFTLEIANPNTICIVNTSYCFL